MMRSICPLQSSSLANGIWTGSRVWGVVLMLFFGGIHATPSVAEDRPVSYQIQMLEIPDVTSDDPALYRAIRAQLSISAAHIQRVSVADDDMTEADPMNIASRLLRRSDVPLIVWIRDDGSICSVFFHSMDATTGQVETHVRILHFESTGRSSRFEVIANAVASVVEGFLKTRVLDAEPMTPTQPSVTPVSSDPPPTFRHRIESALRYSGTLFADRRFAHGMQVRVGILPFRYAALHIAYTHHLPFKWETDEFRIRVYLRYLEVATYARIPVGSLEFRAGLSASVDLRSWSLRSKSETIAPRRPNLQAIHALGPALNATWRLRDRLVMDVGTGLSIGLNETSYRILRENGAQSRVLDPYRVRFSCRLGLALWL